MDDTEDSTFPGVWNQTAHSQGEEGSYHLTMPIGGILINCSFVFWEEAKLSWFPVLKYIEETESPLAGDGIEWTQSPSGIRNAVLVDSFLGEQTSEPNRWCVMPSSATY